MTPAKNGCQCSCHRTPGMIHFRECCPPDPPDDTDTIADLRNQLEAMTRERDTLVRSEASWEETRKAVADYRNETGQMRVQLAAAHAALREAKSRFIKIENIINRNLFHQQEKIVDATTISTEGWCAIDAALSQSTDPVGETAEKCAEKPLTEKLKEAVAAFKAMSPEAQEEMLRKQRESWVRGQIGMGSDRDEADARAAFNLEQKP